MSPARTPERQPRANNVKLEPMEYVNLGETGLRVSRLCLGMMSFGKHESREWALDEAAAEPIVRRAVEGGVIFFDTADVYNGGQSEVVTGRLLKRLFGMREEYVVATKVHGQDDAGRERARALAQAHPRLDRRVTRAARLDYVDLYQIHRWDPLTPIEETMEALHDVVKAGKARYIGASSMWAWQFAKAQRVAPTRFVSMQNHYNLVYREEEREMIPQCLDQGVGDLAVEPARPRAAGRDEDARGGAAHNARPDRPVRGKPLHARGRLRRRRPRLGGRRGARRPHGAGRACLAAAQAWCHRANRRRDEGRAPRRRACGRTARA